MRKLLCAGLIVWVGMAVAVLAQGERRDLPARDRSSETPRLGPGPGSSTGTRMSLPAPSRAAGVVSPSRDSSTGQASGAPDIPVQTYGWNDAYRVADWYEFNMFLQRLYMQYAFMGAYDAMWRYAQGDSPLTPEVVSLALQNSTLASSLLRRHSEKLQRLISQYEAGTLDRSAFTPAAKETAREIRRLAGKIRKDQFLDYLDLYPDVDTPKYENPDSLRKLAVLADELAATIDRMDRGLQGMVDQDISRVVGVDHLQQPSFDSLSKRIDRIAKTIEKSVTRL